MLKYLFLIPMSALLVTGCSSTEGSFDGNGDNGDNGNADETEDSVRARKAKLGEWCGGGGWGPGGRPLPAVQCVKGLVCKDNPRAPMDAPQGICSEPLAKEGEKCGGGGFGATGPLPVIGCEEGLKCDAPTGPLMVDRPSFGECRAIEKEAELGQKCGASWGPGGPSPWLKCKEGLVCERDPHAPADGRSGRCAFPKSGVGERCGGGLGPHGPISIECKDGLTCKQSRNPPTDAPGGRCVPSRIRG